MSPAKPDPMLNEEKAQEYLDSLPTVGEGQTFCFDCSPDAPCFNRCCRQLTLPLTPYDVLRMRRRLGIPSDVFLDQFASIKNFPDSGLPIGMLRMLKDPDETCPFVTPAGCQIYDDRPCACRCYPLGRGTSLTRDGVAETFYLVQEKHCQGFVDGRDWTPQEWFDHEGVAPYNAANDRYMRLGAMIAASGTPIGGKMANMAVLCLYQLDRFKEFIEKMNLFGRVEVEAERQAAILESEEERLAFALDWLELVLFGQCEGLARKG
ncbi:MAG: YkgJ family cysteine cluster protein [Desulfovibrionaceae bacterium]|nr:YkgJ family cysteine cluster protein [Desulfovibrionaceae bacterium]